MTRDQERAQHAYSRVRELRDKLRPQEQKKYKAAVEKLGADILKSGLVAALAFQERNRKDKSCQRLFADLAEAKIPGLDVDSAADPVAAIPAKVRELAAADYMLATREALKVAHWLKRVAQALLEQERP